MVQANPAVSTGSKRSWQSRLYAQRYLQAMAIPGVLFMLLFNYAPMYGIIIAFKQFKVTRTIAASPWVGLTHFQEFLGSEDFLNLLTNTLGMSVMYLTIAFPMAIVFAVLVNEIRSPRFKRAVQTVSYLPHFLSWAILGGILISFMGESGLINEVLVKLGVLKAPVIFLGEAHMFWWISVFSEMWKETGWSAIIYLAAIAGIDQELYEAATVDGVNRWGKIIHITIPSIQGTIVIMLILAISGMLNANFDQILILKNPLNALRSEVFDTYVYRMGIGTGRFSYATAAGLFKSIVSMVLLLLANRGSRALTGDSLF